MYIRIMMTIEEIRKETIEAIKAFDEFYNVNHLEDENSRTNNNSW